MSKVKANFFVKMSMEVDKEAETGLITASTTTVWNDNEVVNNYEYDIDAEDEDNAKDIETIWEEIGKMAFKPIEDSPDANDFGS